MKYRLLAAAAAFAISPAAFAQDAAAPTAADRVADDFHNSDNRTIVITAKGVGALDILAGTSVLEGADLQRNMANQLGDVLEDLPGVSSTSFSPGASRPVLRGFQGERVKVLTDGLGTLDASNTSADHAVTINPLTAERIEVLRGPAVLLYGSQAIGGAVNVLDKRIPRARPDELIHVDAEAGVGSAADLYEGGASLDLPVSDKLAVHVDGSYHKTDDVDVPGYVLSPSLRAEILDSVAEEVEEGNLDEAAELQEAADQRGVLPNSATETYSIGAGATIFAGNSSLGASIGYYDTNYGVPARPGTGHHHEEGEGGDEEGGEEEEVPVTIGLQQWRADVRGEFAFGGSVIDAASLRVGYSDYTHTEFEGDETGTVFDVSGFEGRLTLTQAQRGNWGGSFGVQASTRDFVATGAEAFVAPNITDQYAVFALQQIDFEPFGIEIGGRYERTDVTGEGFRDRNFDTVSGAISLTYDIRTGLETGATLSRAARAPSAEELYADGPHIATQEYEFGDPDLREESSIGGEVFLRGDVGPVALRVAAYANWFKNYIYLSETGEEIDDLPVFQYLQDDARYLGVEAEASATVARAGAFDFNAELGAGYVNAELEDGTPLPRIPPLELTGALSADSDMIGARVELAYSAEQTNLAPLETPTDDFLFVNASLTVRPFSDQNVSLLAQVRNIFDEEGRRHASATKDFVPLPGRDFRLSARLSF